MKKTRPLEYAVPYALASTPTGQSKVVYTRRFGASWGCTAWLIWALVLFLAALLLLAGFVLGWNTSTPTRYGTVPVWTGVACIGLAVAGISYAFWYGRKRDQVEIDTENSTASFWVREKPQEPAGVPKLFVQEATLSQHNAQVFLVVIADDVNSVILGAFINTESATELAHIIAKETGLNIDEHENGIEEYRVVGGSKSMFGVDGKAIKNRKRIKPIQT